MSLSFDNAWGHYPAFVEFNLEHFDGPNWQAWKLRNTSGWLQVIELTMMTPLGQQKRTVAISCNDEGVTSPNWETECLLGLPASQPLPSQHAAPDELRAIAEMARYDFMGECDGLALAALEALEDKTRAEIRELETRLDQVTKGLDAEISELRVELRSPFCIADRKVALRQQIDKRESEEATAQADFIRERRQIRNTAEAREAALIESLTYEADVEILYTIQFEARMRGYERPIRWPLIQEEAFTAGWSEERAQEALQDHLKEAESRREATAAQQVQDALDEAEWLAAARQKKVDTVKHTKPIAKQLPKAAKTLTVKPKTNLPDQPRQEPPAQPQRPLSKVEEHTALKAEIAAFSDILRHSGRANESTKMGLWRVTRRKQPQPEERRAIYHAIGQIEDAVRKFPRVVAYVTTPPDAAAAPPEKPSKPRPPAWAKQAAQLEQIAEARRLLSPKSKVALAKLKSGQTALTETDRNAMKHLIAQLKKTGFDVDGFLAVKDTDQDQTQQHGCSQEQKRGP